MLDWHHVSFELDLLSVRHTLDLSLDAVIRAAVEVSSKAEASHTLPVVLCAMSV